MKYKKIYIEITNICNLNCSFCVKHTRKKEFMSLEQFQIILEKIKNYTDYIYLHVMGEPFMHPDVCTFIEEAIRLGFHVNITTNGYEIKKINDHLGIRQINISLHSFDTEKISLDDYLKPIFEKTKCLAEEGTFVNYRLWVKNQNYSIIKERLEKEYHVSLQNSVKKVTLSKNIFYSEEDSFEWPISRQGKGKCSSFGSCLALKDHIAILVDGTVVPCCLDNNATICLGNIFKDELFEIIKSPIYQKMLNGFQKKEKIHPFCRNCNFYDTRK